MIVTTLDTLTYGAKAEAITAKDSPLALLKRTKGENPEENRETIFRLAFDRGTSDHSDMNRAVWYSYMTNAWSRLDDPVAAKYKPSTPLKNTIEKAADAKVKAVKDRIAKLQLNGNWKMPNGLNLRDCTFRYAGEINDRFAALVAIGADDPDRVIRTVLTDNQIAAL
jgi:hypothetical protein